MSSPDTEDVVRTAPAPSPPAAAAGARIQVVGGDHDVLAALERALRSEGYECASLHGGGPGEVLLELRPLGARPPPPVDEPALVRLDAVIRRHVLHVFHATRDNVTRTAIALGISRVALRRRLREYGAKPPA